MPPTTDPSGSSWPGPKRTGEPVSGRAGTGRRRVLLRDVAEASGVSLAQASGALSGRSDVSEATRERVRQTAERLGYQPSEHARRLGGRQRGPLRCAVVIAGPATSSLPEPQRYQVGWFSSSLLDGALIRAADLGMDVRILRLTQDEVAHAATLQALVARDGADAVILQGFAGVRPEHLQPLRDAGLPYALLNRHFDGHPVVDAAAADFGAAAADAVDRLVADGRRDLVLMVGAVASSVVGDYCEGWQTAVRRHRLVSRSRIVRVDHSDPHVTATAVRELLAPQRRPVSGLAVVDGAAAHQVLVEANARGIVVPEDLSVITFQSSVAPFTMPTLSAYDLKLGEVGAAAVDIVASQLGLVSGRRRRGVVRVAPSFLPGGSTLCS